ncbi:MAG: NAD(P)-dependent oxidoreductase [Candidatus Paceibacterota bacterium]|jgi:dTDP-4-dehydrorhamnose reductase
MSGRIDQKKIVVIGAAGALGSYFTHEIRLSREDLNITDTMKMKDIMRRLRPQVVVHLAAVTDMKLCEEDPEMAERVNGLATENIATAARDIGARVVYISTNAVFDGEKAAPYAPTDEPHPVSVYGRSKRRGEIAVLASDPRNLVIRTSWIFGGGPSHDRKFVGKMLPKLLSGEAVKAIGDVRGTPTYGRDLAKAVEQLMQDGASGIVHVVNAGNASRYDMAALVRDVIGSKSDVESVPQSAFPGTGNTLRNEMLDAEKNTLRPWQEALAEYIRDEWKISIKG